MSEEKKETLQDELENLAETFQTEYDKTAAEEEAAAEPVFDQPEPADEVLTEEKEVKKVPKKKGSILSNLVTFVLLIALLLVTAGVSFYASAFTEIDSYIYNMKCAESAENTADKISFYTEALNLLQDETAGKEKVSSLYRGLMQKANEQITVCTADTEGYAAAMSYMHENLTEDEIAAPKTAEFKAFLKIAGVFENLADDCVEKVTAVIGDGVAEVDYATLATSYTTNETLAADIEKILTSVGEAVTAEKNADIATACEAYAAANEVFAEYSTTSRILIEKYAVCLAQTEGYAAALKYVNENIDAEDETAPLTTEFADFAGIEDILAKLADSIYDEVKPLVGTDVNAPANFDELVAALNAPAYVEAEIAGLYADTANGFAKINAGSYATAVEAFTAVADSFTSYGTESKALNECVVIATAYANGYAAALAAAEEITAEDYEAATEEFAAFLAAGDVFETLDETQYAAVAAAVADITDAQNTVIDLSALVDNLDIPACLRADAQVLLTDIARGVISENADKKAEALAYYKTTDEAFKAIGATATLVLEKMAVLTYETEDLHAAYTFVHSNETALASDADAAITEEFATLLTTLSNAFSPELVAAFITNAQAALVEAGYGDIDVAAVVEESGIDSSVADFYEAYYTPLAGALKAENDKNLTLAIAEYKALAELLKADNVILPEALLNNIISTAFISGDLAVAVEYSNEIASADDITDEEFKAVYEKVKQCDAAMQSAYEVFYEAYYASYYGSVPARNELTEKFEALLTEDSTNYDRAFNLYYRFICEMYFFAEEADSKEQQSKLLAEISELIPDMIFYYGYEVLNSHFENKEYEQAKELVNKMLAINAYDDTALAALAQISRIEGDLTTALEYAKKGIASKNEQYNSELEYIILCMLNNTFTDAYDSVVAIYDKGLSSMQECELIAVYAALFTDATEEQKTKLSEIVTYIENDLYGSYSYTYTENAKALIDGTKTLNDVFMSEPYGLF
ncbi:MAG: hypothetical protein IJO14_02740 [Clostridia bacterium]|nr:hypothetical protein [Clostridia bacterium]